ncbi:hypothetical protein ACIP5N_21975 [Streptomyces sp. NPDC088768]|uniref:hypothetical protein n=1 Tax=Streptomyces sp. NPDC088768 TaxID=3365894 RepID=UPI0037F7EF90
MSSNPTAPGLLHGVCDTLASAGVRQVSDAETWVNADGELLVKIAVAPDERAGAAEIPERLLSDSTAPDSLSTDEALRVGHTVRVTRG